ncbi:uncharacterized protein LOC112557542 [Pomacea canaliculata]|uniref:uncharacterized protein LOC112557542 n=1 Tax=Pomacea canaliculata TaxID=400727 RepID=UPI000D7330DC|nr:uncharacterized protein LOC112557542 [Pomacea canaliculata]
MAGSKARQAFLGLVLQCLATFVLISRVNGDTLCFACDKIFHPAGCGNLARCGPHEVCFTVMGTSGASSDADFTSGCMPREDCEGSIGGNLHPFHTELCSQCCHTDLCNAYLCEQKLPNGMICAKCDDVSDVDTCLKVAFCQGGEVCSSTLAPQSNTYTLGCQKKEACTGTTACCDNADLCNLNLTKTISNPRQVSVTSTPSSTTSWPSATDSETIATFESTVGVDHVTPTTVTFFSSVDNNTTWGWTVCPHHQYPWRPEHSVGDEYAWCHRKSRCDVRGKSLLQQHGRMVHIRFSDDGCNSGQQDNTVCCCRWRVVVLLV